MKFAISALAFAAITVSVEAAQYKTQAVFETFEHPNPGGNQSCGAVNTCPDALPGPSNGLTFNNLQAQFVYPRPGGEQAYDGEFYAEVSNSTQPAVLSSDYKNTCVESWKLNAFAGACQATQTFTDPNSPDRNYTFPYGANCTFTATGKDRHGKVVGTDSFRYNPGGLQLNQFGLPQWGMTSFNTTRRGLLNKQIHTLEISAKVIPGNDPNDVYAGGFGYAVDAIHFILTNRTGCVYHA